MNATDVMSCLRVDTLKSIAKIAGISRSVTRKAELITALDRFVHTDPSGFVERLGSIERNMLAEAVYNNNCVNPVVFSAKYNVPCPRPTWGKNASLIHMVIAEDRYSDEIQVPQTVADMLRPLLEKPTHARPVTVDTIPETLDLASDLRRGDPTTIRPIHLYAGQRTVFLELRRVLQLVQGGKVRVQAKSGRPTPATARAIAGSLAAPDFDLELPAAQRDKYTFESGSVRAHAWAVLVQQCGWCKAPGGTLKLTREGQRLVRDVTPEAFRKGVVRLGSDDKFDELQRVNHIRGQTGKARRWMTKPSERRETICFGLAEWPENEWLAFDEAYRFLHACGYPFSVSSNPMSLYFCEQRYGYINDPDDLDRQYLRAFLLETLATLGLVDVAYVYPHYLWPELSGGWGTDDMDFCGRYDGLLYVRLNLLGMYCLGRADQYTPPAAEKRSIFTVLPNREIAVAGDSPLLPADASMLELFARQRSDHLWRIDQQTILDYLENGGSLDDVLRYLVENSAEEIPDTIRVLVDDTRAKADAVAGAQEAWLVEFKDAEVAVLVAHDTKAGKLCLLAGDRHVAVPKKNERAFRTALKKLGYVLPR